mmetsp:Transcript_3754/g.7486  ORF Transcript_3754/g.7486 Transcript_3754/m.7486 type:complete len:225 (+) Transcript_3754:160-834(+)
MRGERRHKADARRSGVAAGGCSQPPRPAPGQRQLPPRRPLPGLCRRGSAVGERPPGLGGGRLGPVGRGWPIPRQGRDPAWCAQSVEEQDRDGCQERYRQDGCARERQAADQDVPEDRVGGLLQGLEGGGRPNAQPGRRASDQLHRVGVRRGIRRDLRLLAPTRHRRDLPNPPPGHRHGGAAVRLVVRQGQAAPHRLQEVAAVARPGGGTCRHEAWRVQDGVFGA